MAQGSPWRYAVATCVAALAIGSCIYHPVSPEPASSSTETPAAKPENAAPLEPTGNWGKVEGVDVLGGRGIHAFQLHGAKERVRVGHIKVEGQPFHLALRAEILEQSPNIWDVQDLVGGDFDGGIVGIRSEGDVEPLFSIEGFHH